MKKKRYTNQQPGIFEIIILSFIRLLWWLISLPFKGISQKKGLNNKERAFVYQKRTEIENLIKSENTIELKHAVMEADKLVDFKLKALGVRGETFADRLRNAERNINPAVYNEIWQGHKMRNQIAHEQRPEIRNNELRNAARKLINFSR